jgi:hypothetical protein
VTFAIGEAKMVVGTKNDIDTVECCYQKIDV